MKKKKIPTRTKLLWSAVVAIILFTIVAIILQFYTQTELSSTLITCWYGFWTVELWNLSRITITKTKNNHYEE